MNKKEGDKMRNIPIGEVLKEYGYITESQLKSALEYQKLNKNKRLGDILIELGFVTESRMLEALGKRLSVKKVSFNDIKVDIDAVRIIPKQLCLKYTLIPFQIEKGTLKVAVNDPLNFYAIEDIRMLSNMTIDIFLCEKQEILNLIEYYYAEIEAQSMVKTALPQPVTAKLSEYSEKDEAPVVRLLNSLLIKGCSSQASDIHIEPFEGTTSVRMRIDGAMLDYVNIAKAFHQAIIARIKIMANMNIAERRIPQDGHFRTVIDKTDMNVRVSVIPTVYGEKAVLRFLNSGTEITDKSHFGMSPENFRLMNRLLDNPHGMLLITGPTGSGKTTTLYLALERLSKKAVNISTIEDPVEKNIAKANQMQVNIPAGLTFETGLRALLRQDPDIIMVGETRDSQTASISVSAAITGHLVLSTLHTNDAVSAVARLTDMGVESYMLSASLKGVVAQRLVRKICKNCKTEYAASPSEKQLLKSNVRTLYKGEGCHICNYTGYKGRQAVHEILFADRQLLKLIAEKAPAEKLYDYAEKNLGMKTLTENAAELVLRGITTTEELMRLSFGL
ncbi:MAG: ATPase, T2SS/T4P/T4SS family [Oscillospiraceae bacterium]|jgi:type IV pilus assembly protein PilB